MKANAHLGLERHRVTPSRYDCLGKQTCSSLSSIIRWFPLLVLSLVVIDRQISNGAVVQMIKLPYSVSSKVTKDDFVSLDGADQHLFNSTLAPRLPIIENTLISDYKPSPHADSNVSVNAPVVSDVVSTPLPDAAQELSQRNGTTHQQQHAHNTNATNNNAESLNSNTSNADVSDASGPVVANELDTKHEQQHKQHATTANNTMEYVESNTSNASLAAMNVSDLASAPANEATRHERLSSTQILALLEATKLNYDQAPFIFPKPPIDSYDISSIYSKSAWMQLRQLLNRSEEVVLCVNGGSSSAGSVDIKLEDRYHSLIAKAYPNVTVVDRSHGARNSMHSVHMMHSFLPERTDILIWEFAINDVEFHQLSNKTIVAEETRNELILWLDQVARVAKQRQAKPPLVIFVYLWNACQFSEPQPQPHSNMAFEAQRGVAQNYDFVVGHINVGKYFQSLWEDRNVTQTYFLDDPAHGNILAHRVFYHLLQDLVSNEERNEQPRTNHSSPSSYVWSCGDETPEKRLMRGLLLNRHVIASFTQEVPKNENLLSGMLLPLVGGELKITNLGKSNALRSDRKYSAVVPCCGQSMMSFDDVWKHGVLEGVHFIVHPNATGLTFYFDDQNVTDKLINCIDASKWQCIFSEVRSILNYWIVLESPRNVSNIGICNNLSTCNETNQILSIQSLSVYGEE